MFLERIIVFPTILSWKKIRSVTNQINENLRYLEIRKQEDLYNFQNETVGYR